MSDHDQQQNGSAPGEDEEAQGQIVEVEELDEEALARRRAALSQIRQWGDPLLRSQASVVTDFGTELQAEAERMIELMRDALGVGLAATQLGVLRRVLVYQAGIDEEPRALVNPEIEWASEEELEAAEEGCLSLQGISVEVERPARIRVRAKAPDGSAVEIEAEGLEARVIQHEVDHLDGVLILDRTIAEHRRAAVAALREGSTFEPADLLPDEEPAETESDPAPAESPPAEPAPAERGS